MENTGREGSRDMNKHFSTDEAMIRDFYRNVTGYGELSGAAMDSMLKDAALVAGIRGYYDGQITLAQLGWA